MRTKVRHSIARSIWRALGEAGGLVKGRAESECTGQVSLLTGLLRRKLGRLPKGAKGLIDRATGTELDARAVALLTAESYSGVFGKATLAGAGQKKVALA